MSSPVVLLFFLFVEKDGESELFSFECRPELDSSFGNIIQVDPLTTGQHDDVLFPHPWQSV